MPRSRMCQYGNCNEEVSTASRFMLTVTERSVLGVNEQVVFCCYEHAWRYLKDKDERANGPRNHPQEQ